MKATLATALLALLCASAVAPAFADEEATNVGPLTPAEQQFVNTVKADLVSRFPHASDAVKAGYVRYTAADDTGAISYANPQYWQSDPTHPSQLWYDKSGNLMGADFAVPRPNGEPRPQLWGIDPGRWYEFNGHVHYVIHTPDGRTAYDQWVWNKDFVAAGGSLTHPSAATLVDLGRVPSAQYISAIFEMPTQWDLIVWLVPHAPDPLHW
jgi:hypothetical protein